MTSPITSDLDQQVRELVAECFVDVHRFPNAKAVCDTLIDRITAALQAERERCDRLSDSQYIAGMTFGWNCCEAGNHQMFQQAVESRRREAAITAVRD